MYKCTNLKALGRALGVILEQLAAIDPTNYSLFTFRD
jgi:hypothetical protein